MGELTWPAPDEGDKVNFIWWLRHQVGVRTPRCTWFVPTLAGQPWGKLLNLWISLPTQFVTHNFHLILKGKERHLKRTASLYLGPYWPYTGLEHLISQGFACQGLGLAILLASLKPSQARSKWYGLKINLPERSAVLVGGWLLFISLSSGPDLSWALSARHHFRGEGSHNAPRNLGPAVEGGEKPRLSDLFAH